MAINKFIFEKEFHQKKDHDDFTAYTEACKWCSDLGIDYGSMERSQPIGLARNAYIAKWSNISRSERSSLEGVMTSFNWRRGPVYIELKFNPEQVKKC